MNNSAVKSSTHTLSVNAQLYLLLSLTLAVAPHVVRIPVWITLFACLALILKLTSFGLSKFNLQKPLIVLLGFLVVVGVGLHYSTIFGRDAGVSLLIGMLYIKLLETRNYRDAMVMVNLSYFVVLTNLLFTQSIPTAVYMLLQVFIITVTLIVINSGPSKIAANAKFSIALPLFLLALPLAFFLFILFPRIPGPIWGLPQDVYSARSGMSDTMSPGMISELVLSDKVAFRATFTDQIPPQNALYWRALVLSGYDGRKWRVEDSGQVPIPDMYISGLPIEYTVTLEPHHQRWLYALEMPVINTRSEAPAGTRLLINRNGELRSTKAIAKVSQYRIGSYPNYVLNTNLGTIQRQRALHLPTGSDPQTIQLVSSWLDDNLKPEQIIDKALALFRNEFTYTLLPPKLGQHIIDEFLFKTKKGFCEHFTAAFVVMMRAAGIPARVVVGYQGGEYNPMGNYLIVRQSDAHAWAEVWLPERGWVRIDPTSAVSPARIERGLDQAIPAADNPRLSFWHNNRLFTELGTKFRRLWDSVNASWNDWVLGYNPELQRLLLKYLGFKNSTAYHLVAILTIILALTLIVISLFALKVHRPAYIDPVQRIYLKLCKKLANVGYQRKKSEGANTFLSRIQRHNKILGEQVSPIINSYIELRYRQASIDENYLRKFKQSVRQIGPLNQAHNRNS